MGRHAPGPHSALAGVGLLAVVLLTGAVVPAASAASPSPPGAVSLSEVRVTTSGVTAILTARGLGGARIDPASVKATLGGAGARLSVQPIAQERRYATLLIDASGSMGPTGMQTVRRATDVFLGAAPKDVYVGAVAFSTVPKVLTPPTLDRARVRAAVAGLTSQGETSRYDGMGAALAQLGHSGGRSFVLLSDGGDTRSRSNLHQTLTALSASGVRAQVVGFKTTDTQDSVLSSLASARHGSVVSAGNSAAVSVAFTAAAQAPDSQIRIVVIPPRSAVGNKLVVFAAAGGKSLRSPALNVPVPSPAAIAFPPSVAMALTLSVPPRPQGESHASWLLWLALLALFIGVVGVVGALLMPTYVSRRQRQVEAIEGLVKGVVSGPLDERSAVTSIAASLVNLGDKVMDSRTSSPKTLQLLDRADLPLRLGEWAVLRGVFIVVGMAGGILLLHVGPAATFTGGFLGALVGVVGPALFLKFAASRRAKRFETQLPDVLTLVASSLSTGFSLLQALDAVARDAADPAAKEFSRALAETRIGADLNDALNHLADRMDSINLRWATMAINIQRQVGGNLSETLRNTAATLRDRESLRRHVNALSAEGKLSAYILIALPIGIFLYMTQVNLAYVQLLWTTLIGMGMLGAGLISLVIGVFWMRKVVTVEV